MTGAAGALAFLVRRTARNRLVKQLSRLRSPRYAIAAVLGIGYLVLIFGTQSAGSPARSNPLAGEFFGRIAEVGFAITALIWWLGRSPVNALAFQPAEVQLLFPAPLSRHQLMAYKVARSQLLLLISCVIWTLLARNWGADIIWPLRFASIWALFTVLGLHRIGTALVQAAPVQGTRRAAQLLGRTAAFAIAGGLAYGLAPAFLGLQNRGIKEGLRGLHTALSVGPASIALTPFRALVAPLYATSLEAWAGAFAVLVAVVALHLVWVLRMNVEFEELAATASADAAKRIAAFKASRSGAGVVMKPGPMRRTRLPLAPRGNPAAAIVWKNTIAFLRTGTLKGTLVLVGVLVAMTQGIALVADDGGDAVLAIPFAAFAFISLLMGPRTVRNDLRQDLQSLALLKSYPMNGTTLVAAEMVSPTLMLAGFQSAMLGAAYLTLPPEARALADGATTIAIAAVAPIVLIALNGMTVGIQNAMALAFPGWVRLGSDSGGIEAIGQNLVVTLGSLLALILSMILPALGAGLAFFFFSYSPLAAIVVGGIVGTLILALEIVGMIGALGKLFERTDPTAIG